jgi:carbon starvation protein
MFGVANQLLAVIALAVGTTVLLKMGQSRYAWTTLAPMSFMVVTTTTAGILNIQRFLTPKFAQSLPDPGNATLFVIINVGLTVVLLACVAVILATSARKWLELLRTGSGKDLTETAVIRDAGVAAA